MSDADPTVSVDFAPTPQPDGSELASQVISLLSITLMCTLLGIKTNGVKYRYLTYSRWLVLLLYFFSWAFTISSTLMVSTNNGNYTSCLLSMLSCDIFYAGTKLTIYTWLVEKVWVVSSVGRTRWQSLQYRFHIFLLTPYVGILALMLTFHNVLLLDDGTCVIGLRYIASIPLMIYDFLFNLYMTALFIKPLMAIGKSVTVDWRTSRLHDVARRTLIASVVCLFVSLANLLGVIILDGHERGVVCLTCCVVDVTINVVTVHWVTTNPKNRMARGGNQSSTLASGPDRSDGRFNTKSGDSKMDEMHNGGFPRAERPYPSRYVTIAEKGMEDAVYNDSHSTASVQESQSSRKSLTKPGYN